MSEPRELNRLEVLHGLKTATYEASYATIWATLTGGAYLTGFALWLGAGPGIIGVVTAIPTFAGLIQLVSSYFGERLPTRKPFTALFSIIGRTLWLPILLLPFVLGRERSLYPFLLLFALSYLCMNIPVPAYLSWMSDLVPPDHRGRYFARRNMIAGFVGMLIGLPAAWFLDAATRKSHNEAMGFGVLFGVGVLLGILAFWKGYTADDKYPGHGDMDRDYKKASTEEAQQHDRVRQKVRELLHHRRAAVQAVLHEPATQVGMLARRVAELTNARGSLQAQASAIKRDYSLVIDAYRGANNAVRAVPAPAYFSQPTLLPMSVDGKGADAVLTDLGAVQEELKTMADANREPLNEKLRELQQSSTELLGKTLTDYLDDVRKDAEAVIARMAPTMLRVSAAPAG